MLSTIGEYSIRRLFVLVLLAVGCVPLAVNLGTALLVGYFLGTVNVPFPESSSSPAISNGSGSTRMQFDGGQMTSYEGILPGFSVAGTTQAILDLQAGRIAGTLTTPDGVRLELAEVLPGLTVSPDRTGVGFNIMFEEGVTSYTYTLTVEPSANDVGVGFAGVASVGRQSIQNGTVVLDDRALGSVEATREDVPGSGRPTPLDLPAVPIRADAGSLRTITAGESVMLDASASGGTGVLAFAWEPRDSLNNPTLLQPSAAPQASTTYTLTVADSNGQQVVDSVVVQVQEEVLDDADAEPDFEYSFRADGADVASLSVSTLEDGMTIEQQVRIPAEVDPSSVNIFYYRPDGELWPTSAPTVQPSDSGSLFVRQLVRIDDLPLTGLWTTVMTYQDLIIDGRQFVLERPPAEASNLIVVNSERDSPLLCLVAGADRRIWYYLGTRDDEGIPLRVKAIIDSRNDGHWFAYHLDDNYDLIGIYSDDGEFLSWSNDASDRAVVTAGDVEGVRWERELPVGSASHAAEVGDSQQGTPGAEQEVGDSLYYFGMFEAAGLSSDEQHAANGYFADILGRSSSRPTQVHLDPVRELSQLVGYDFVGEPYLTFVAPNYGFATDEPLAITNVTHLGDELIEATRGFAQGLAVPILESAFGEGILSDDESEALAGFVQRWALDPMADGVRKYVAYRVGEQLGWSGESLGSLSDTIERLDDAASWGEALGQLGAAVGVLAGPNLSGSSGLSNAFRKWFLFNNGGYEGPCPRLHAILETMQTVEQERDGCLSACATETLACVDQCGNDPPYYGVGCSIDCHRQGNDCKASCPRNEIQDRLDACEAGLGPDY